LSIAKVETKLHRRRFIERMTKTGAGLAAAPALLNLVPTAFGASSKDKPLKLCMVSGSEEYKSNESLAAFQELVEKKFPIKCSRAFWKSKTELPGLDALASCDVMLVFTKRLEPPSDQLELIKKYCLAGRPVVGLRTASHAFQKWLEFDHLILGGDYHSHYGAGPATKVAIASGASEHPILKGVEPFETPTKLYKNPHIAEDTNLLLTGTIPDHTEPVAWTRKNHAGRVFYTSLGGPDDFKKKVFQTLLVNAIFWTGVRKPTS
jgi:type 1 glutamine amidotransferase